MCGMWRLAQQNYNCFPFFSFHLIFFSEMNGMEWRWCCCCWKKRRTVANNTEPRANHRVWKLLNRLWSLYTMQSMRGQDTGGTYRQQKKEIKKPTWKWSNYFSCKAIIKALVLHLKFICANRFYWNKYTLTHIDTHYV